MVKDNILYVKKKIEEATKRVGRVPEEITLIAVSKTFGVESVFEARSAGLVDFGENRIQEAKSKVAAVGIGVRWHLIGHLQTNKAKDAVKLFDVIHSVDSLRLAQMLESECKKIGKALDLFLQVNVAGEEQKSGVEPEEAKGIVEEILKLENLKLKGLMTIPPYFDDKEQVRKYYIMMRELKDSINCAFGDNVIKDLSMGMSDDYEIAIEEGATHIRVGTAIFGNRTYE